MSALTRRPPSPSLEDVELAMLDARKALKTHGSPEDAALVERLDQLAVRLVIAGIPPPLAHFNALQIELLTCRGVIEHGLWFISRARDQAEAAGELELAGKLKRLADVNGRALPALLEKAYPSRWLEEVWR